MVDSLVPVTKAAKKEHALEFGRLHDVLFFYAGGADYTWNRLYLPLSEDYVKSHYTNVDENG